MNRNTLWQGFTVFIIISMMLVIAGCDLTSRLFGKDGNNGVLILTISENDVQHRTILPDINMDIASYTITGTGPNGATFTADLTDSSVFVRDNLAVGDWIITVDAYNSGDEDTDPEKIASGSKEIAIQASSVTNTTITVRPLTGTGTLELDVVWNQDLPNAEVVLTLTDSNDDEVEYKEVFAIEEQEGSIIIDELGTGYYLLEVQLVNDGAVFGTAVKTVRIVKGQTTSGQIDIMLDASGNLSLTISQEMENPIEITFTGAQSSLVLGSDMTVTAETDEEVDRYAWYLNGIRLTDETDDTITIGAELTEGEYRLTVVVWKGNVISSERVSFSVTTNPDALITETYFSNSKILLKGELGASFDREAIMADASLNAVNHEGNLYWDIVIEKSEGMIQGRTSSSGFFDGEVLRTLICEEGHVYIGPITGTPSVQLLLLVQGSLSNTHDFSGNALSSSVFGIEKGRSTDTSIKHNFLGWALAGDRYISHDIHGYAYLYNNGYVIEGPSSYYELYNKPYVFYNFFSSPITVADSFLINNRIYMTRPFRTINNTLWSPIGSNPNQNINLARSFDISYSGNSLYSAVHIRAYTDNGMSSQVKIYGMDSPPDYTSTGSQSGWGSWAVTYNADDETYRVNNYGCASGLVFLQNQYPERVEMSGNTTWSTFYDSFSIAIVGGDMAFSNLGTTPYPGDDGNPAPFVLVIETGANHE